MCVAFWRWFSLVTFFSSLKFSICLCHFVDDLLIWPVTLPRENIEIILYVKNHVEPLIKPSNFFSSLKFSICVCHFRNNLFIWPVNLSGENIEIILYVQNPVDPLIQPDRFIFKSKIFNMCVSFWRWFIDLTGNSI